MPTRPPTACTDPGCPNTRPCPDHPARTWAGKPMPRGWKATRARILARDSHRCRNCGTTEALEVHHTIPGAEADETLVTLCRPCHRAITAAQALAGRHASRPLAAAAALDARQQQRPRRSAARPVLALPSPAPAASAPAQGRVPRLRAGYPPPRPPCGPVIPTPVQCWPGSAEKSRVAHARRGRMVDLRRHHRALAGPRPGLRAPVGPLPCRVTDNGAVICPGCGAAVPQRRGRGRPRRWCSDRCRSAESSRRARQRAARQRTRR
jgi:5-methylcytosine-specific restriction endonuclease McrA